MPEQVQKILTKITDWWKKFTTKQRILLGSIVAVIILALVILAVVVGKPNMVTLIECSSTAQAGEVKDLLDNDGSISYQMSDDGLTFYVDEKDNAAATGTINYDTSSIAIVVKNYVIYDEDTLRTSGALDNMTFDEYIAANSDPVKTTVDQDNYTMIANATGFPEANISIIAYDEPIFQYSSGGRTLSDYLQIILAVLILLLLGYVVFRSTRKEKQAEMEEELSVESLLESTKENQEPLEDIGYNEKSETRLLIEKFVEEKPEAAASLLRNWLNEEWE